jgi:hypothetical protein
MIRELIEMARRDENIAWGECFIVHLGPDGEINPQRSKSVAGFLRDWRRLPGIQEATRAIGRGRSVQHRWLGVVHDDGIFVTPFERHPAHCNEPDRADWWKQL